MKVIVSLLLLVLSCVVSHAQGFSISLVPSQDSIISPALAGVPPAKPFNRYDTLIYAAVVGSRLADYATTEHQLQHGYVEGGLPTSLVKNKGAFLAYSLVVAGGEVGISILLHKHGHRNLARTADIISAGVVSYIAMHNMTQPGVDHHYIQY